MRQDIKYIALALLLLIGVSSCKTRQTYRNLGENRQISKSDWKVTLAWKGSNFSSKMRLEASESEGLYASLRPYPFIELARFWFTPKEAIVLDMMDKRYARMKYRDLSKELGKKLSYQKLESLYFEELKRQTQELSADKKPAKIIKLGQAGNKSIKLSLLRNKLLTSSEDLHIEPKIKDSYEKISLKELKFLFDYLLNKVK